MNESRPCRVDGLAFRELADGSTVVLQPDGKAALVLNVMGAAVLDLCDGQRAIADVAALICDVFPDAARDQVEADVAALVEKLTEAGCLRR